MNINYFKEFLHSKDNLILVGLTIGIGFMSGNVFGLILGLVGYGIGFMFLHDSKYFKSKINKKYQNEQTKIEQDKMSAFKERQNACYCSLSNSRKAKYNDLVSICKDIENATMTVGDSIEGSEMRLRKIDELMWTYMKLLCISQSIEVFLEYERKEDIPVAVNEADIRIKTLVEEIEKLKTKGSSPLLDSKQKLFNSLSEQVSVLHKRIQRIEMAKVNVEVVQAEQDRLTQQIKLLRAEAMASKNAEALSSKIDNSVSTLEETNKWLSQMTEFQDFSDDIPVAEKRIGFKMDSSSEGKRIKERVYNR